MTVIRNLTLITEKLPASLTRRGSSGASAMFWWGLVAVLLQFILPYVVLEAIGLPSDKVKVHPATVLVLFGAIYALASGVKPFAKRCREAPGLTLFVFAIPALALYSIFFVGYSGSAIYLDSYWSAALLAVMLETASPKQKRFLAKLMIALCVINVFVALIESSTHTLWFPLNLDPDIADKLTDTEVDFRANAFFNHPLTGSLVTAMSIFLLYGMRMRLIYSAALFGILLVGLFAYGGRTALGVTLTIVAVSAIWTLFSGIVRRNLELDFVIAFIAGTIVIPLLIFVIVTQTNISERIIDTLYFDGSAEVRVTQWEVFRLLSLENWLFGISHDNLDILKYQIGLGGKQVDIENFWALMLLNLGAIGFAAFLLVFAAFLWHLGKQARNVNGWLLLIAALIIDTSSNSLGVKSSDLFIETAFLIGMAGYAGYKTPRRIRFSGPGAVVPLQSHARGLRVLRPMT
jgi:hypothetical protein